MVVGSVRSITLLSPLSVAVSDSASISNSQPGATSASPAAGSGGGPFSDQQRPVSRNNFRERVAKKVRVRPIFLAEHVKNLSVYTLSSFRKETPAKKEILRRANPCPFHFSIRIHQGGASVIFFVHPPFPSRARPVATVARMRLQGVATAAAPGYNHPAWNHHPA